MKKNFKILLLSIILIIPLYSQPKISDISTRPGAFSRMGFGARGIGMGNAMGAVNSGNLSSYYNPAVIPFQDKNYFQSGYTFLTFDRTLNFLNFTKKFDFYTADGSKIKSSAGLSIGIINSGVSKIDSRDNEGNKGEELSTSENQYFVGLSNKFSERFSMGISIKFYYNKLYKEIHSSSLGIDIGALYKISDKFYAAIVITDINSKYKWDTSPIYEQDGSISTDNFPLLKKFALSYTDKDIGIIADAEIEISNFNSKIFRFGAEYNLYEGLYFRAGFDNINLSNKDFPVKPSAGFSYYAQIAGLNAGIDYAYQIEQYSPSNRHFVSLNIIF